MRVAVRDNLLLRKQMPLPFALCVQRFNRRGMTVSAISSDQRAEDAEVMKAHSALGLPVDDSVDPERERSADQREAEIERLQKRMRDRNRVARGAGGNDADTRKRKARQYIRGIGQRVC